MMYHFMLGLRAGSTAPAVALSPPPVPASFFSSSCIGCPTVVDCATSDPSSFLAMAEITEHRIDTVSDHQIHRPEIRREQENRDDDHNRGGLHFLERGRRDLFHLGADVAVESFDPLRPRLDAIAEIAAGSCQ